MAGIEVHNESQLWELWWLGRWKIGRRTTRKCLDLRGGNMVSHIIILMAELSSRNNPLRIQGGKFLGDRTLGILAGLPPLQLEGG